jgi:Ni/Fe-hydrogenase subunit HybB-like protein
MAESTATQPKSTTTVVMAVLAVLGVVTFLVGLGGGHPKEAWRAYLINFLLWSAMAQGGLLFSAVLQVTNARWGRELRGISEAFSAFFPVSLVLFLILFLGREHIFPWLHMDDLHGKEVWLNIPFLFVRDLAGLGLLYFLGFLYFFQALRLKRLPREQRAGSGDPDHKRLTTLGVLYIITYTFVLSLIGYDLVMSLDPHWISTLFGPYIFIKAFYLGIGGLIIISALMHLNADTAFRVPDKEFHDIGKLFLAFCLVWADFFYVQLVVIWYGNIPEETVYVISRVGLAPWRTVAWSVFGASFVIPFLVLINRKIKTMPRLMLPLCGLVLVGLWFEHLLLVGPALDHGGGSLNLSVLDLVITLGFLGLMGSAIGYWLKRYPELAAIEGGR